MIQDQNSIRIKHFQRFFEDARGDMERTELLYRWNLMVSEALYVPLHGLEVNFSHIIHEIFSQQIGHFWFDAIADKEITSAISLARYQLIKYRQELSAYNIVCKLTFGFWIRLLNKEFHISHWNKNMTRIFQNKPKGLNPSRVRQELCHLRNLRNMIAHHEPVYARNLPADHERIYHLLSWMNTSLTTWFAEIDRFPVVYKEKPQWIN